MHWELALGAFPPTIWSVPPKKIDTFKAKLSQNKPMGKQVILLTESLAIWLILGMKFIQEMLDQVILSTDLWWRTLIIWTAR